MTQWRATNFTYHLIAEAQTTISNALILIPQNPWSKQHNLWVHPWLCGKYNPKLRCESQIKTNHQSKWVRLKGKKKCSLKDIHLVSQECKVHNSLFKAQGEFNFVWNSCLLTQIIRAQDWTCSQRSQHMTCLPWLENGNFRFSPLRLTATHVFGDIPKRLGITLSWSRV